MCFVEFIHTFSFSSVLLLLSSASLSGRQKNTEKSSVFDFSLLSGVYSVFTVCVCVSISVSCLSLCHFQFSLFFFFVFLIFSLTHIHTVRQAICLNFPPHNQSHPFFSVSLFSFQFEGFHGFGGFFFFLCSENGYCYGC